MSEGFIFKVLLFTLAFVVILALAVVGVIQL